jgi:hypothetical protein
MAAPSHDYQFHTLEREGSLNEYGDDCDEPICAQTTRQTRPRDWPWVVPILELEGSVQTRRIVGANAILPRSCTYRETDAFLSWYTSQVNDETDENEASDE